MKQSQFEIGLWAMTSPKEALAMFYGLGIVNFLLSATLCEGFFTFLIYGMLMSTISFPIMALTARKRLG